MASGMCWKALMAISQMVVKHYASVAMVSSLVVLRIMLLVNGALLFGKMDNCTRICVSCRKVRDMKVRFMPFRAMEK